MLEVSEMADDIEETRRSSPTKSLVLSPCAAALAEPPAADAPEPARTAAARAAVPQRRSQSRPTSEVDAADSGGGGQVNMAATAAATYAALFVLLICVVFTN